MSPEVLDRVFEPFFTTKPREYGSGLGLAIVYGIVQQSSGHIAVESTPGEGTTFSVYLPYVVPPSEPEAVADEPVEETSIPRGRETILVVEDDELVRGITVRSLRALGYRILLAEDGEDAMRVVQQHEGDIDLVVTDVAMPRMGGPELAEKLTARNPAVKVLFVSGYSEQELSERVILARNRAFLDKPFTASMLARKLREMLELRRADAGPSRGRGRGRGRDRDEDGATAEANVLDGTCAARSPSARVCAGRGSGVRAVRQWRWRWCRSGRWGWSWVMGAWRWRWLWGRRGAVSGVVVVVLVVLVVDVLVLVLERRRGCAGGRGARAPAGSRRGPSGRPRPARPGPAPRPAPAARAARP